VGRNSAFLLVGTNGCGVVVEPLWILEKGSVWMLRRGTGSSGARFRLLVDFLCLVVGDRDMVVGYLLPPQPRWQEGWRRGRQAEMLEDLLEDRRVRDERDHDHCRRAAGAREGVDVHDSSQKLRPGHAAGSWGRFVFSSRDVLVGVGGGW